MFYLRRYMIRLLLLLVAVMGCAPALADSELVFRDLRLRLFRVEENDPGNARDDAAVVTVRTATNSTQLTIFEYSSGYVDEYEIYVMFARPNPTLPGEGTARITVYGPPRGF